VRSGAFGCPLLVPLAVIISRRGRKQQKQKCIEWHLKVIEKKTKSCEITVFEGMWELRNDSAPNIHFTYVNFFRLKFVSGVNKGHGVKKGPRAEKTVMSNST
jgi:ribosomal protein S7